MHLGQLNGEAVPVGNRLHVAETGRDSEPTGCVHDLMLTSQDGQPELQGNDNQRCGGMSVNFWGKWQRFTPTSAKKKVVSAAPATERQ